MYQFLLIVSFLGSFFFNNVESQYSSVPSKDVVTNFKPSLALVIGILSIMLSLTLIILLYAKYCHRRPSPPSFLDQQGALEGVFRHPRGHQFSGIDKKVIESLPFFKFSSLRGAKEGLECAVCLSRFEEIEILRLLPKCRHAFHVSCIDEWLEMHASCPLCRFRINADDPEIFAYSNSLRFLWWNQSELAQQDHQDSNLDIYVERLEDSTSFRRKEKSENHKESLIKKLHNYNNYNYKIIMSDVVFKNRWSNVSSSDLMMLNSEMISDISSDRFSKMENGSGVLGIKEDLEKKRLYEYKMKENTNSCLASSSDMAKTSKIQSEKRSVSEIIGVSRFDYLDKKKRMLKSCLDENNIKDERMRHLWLPIARRTAQWFANREKGNSLDV